MDLMLGFVRLMKGRGDVAVLSTEVGDQMQVKVATAERKKVSPLLSIA